MTSSGQLYGIGVNYYGQLGNATNNGTFNPNPIPTLVALPGQVGAITQIAAGANHSLAVTSSGQLYSFGVNYYGQLGNATNNNTSTPNPTPALVPLAAGTTIGTVAKGPEADHSLALVSNLAFVTTAFCPGGPKRPTNPSFRRRAGPRRCAGAHRGCPPASR